MLFYFLALLAVQDQSKTDWAKTCENVAFTRIKHKTTRSDKSTKFIINRILKGINEYSKDLELNDEQKLELCFRSLATCEMESNYEFAVGSAGEIGMYQFKLDTVRMNRERINFINDYSDSSIVVALLDHVKATRVFLVHFNFLYNKYGDLKQAWKVYNSGSSAEQYSESVFEKYLEIRSLQ